MIKYYKVNLFSRLLGLYDVGIDIDAMKTRVNVIKKFMDIGNTRKNVDMTVYLHRPTAREDSLYKDLLLSEFFLVIGW